ncbi:MAG: prepilin peptidase [Candidatus Saccharimonadales bacterium]
MTLIYAMLERMEWVSSLSIIAFGLLMGSFLGAQVWRLRAHHLVEAQEYGEDYDKKEYKTLVSLIKRDGKVDRSQCLHCGHRLAWYDLLPLVSWISTRGKCRYCKRPIGTFEPLIEIGTALFFTLLLWMWYPALSTGDWQVISGFVLWLVAGSLLAILFAYDLKWRLLPDSIVFPLMVVAGLVAELHIIQAPDATQAVMSLNGAVLILSGLYLALYLIAERLGRTWIGFGDVKLGFALALLLADWRLAFLALFLANLIGCIIILPFMATGKASRGTVIPFGPFLIVGAVIAGLYGEVIISWYLSLLII